MTETSENLQQLVEHIRDWRSEDLRVDKPNRLVRNVALTARDSKNGYRYSEEALRQAVPLYENKPVFLDHAANASRPHERSTRDLVGSIVNPRYEGGRVRGDIHLLDTDSGRTFLALAESRNASVGMSHVVLAERNRDRSVVETIHDVVSVDAVVFPATSSTFSESMHDLSSAVLPGSFESFLREFDRALTDHLHRREQLEANADMRFVRRGLLPGQVVVETVSPDSGRSQIGVLDWNVGDEGITFGEAITPLTAEGLERGDWRSQDRPTFVEWLRTNQTVESLQEQIEETGRQRDQLRERLEALQTAQSREAARREVDRLLESSGLPGDAVTDLFRRQLAEAADEKARKALIDERRRLLAGRPRRHPVSRERPTEDDNSVSDASIVASIKQNRPSVLTGINS